MRFRFSAPVVAALAVGLAASYGQTNATKTPVKRSAARKAKTSSSPAIEEQLQALRHQLESQASQIDSLKTGMAAKDEQLKKAEQSAADAQAAAARAEAAVSALQQTAGGDAAAVGSLQNAVASLKVDQTTLAATVSDETAKAKKAIDSPTTLHYKGVTLAPGGFVEGDTVYRSHATGSDIPTGFSSIPYEHADAYALSEFFGTGRASRITLMVEGKVNWGTLRGYYEGDFIGAATTSNEGQSNSYVLRQRLVYAQAETNSHWSFTGGQMWTLATEDKKGISAAAADIAVPMTADPNYVPGFAWTRQYGFRVAKNFNKAAVAVAIENPQINYAASLAGNTPYAVMGSAGSAGGAFNSGVGSCTSSTAIVNYANEKDSGGYNVAVPVYKTLSSCANLANVSFNQAPDVLVKATFDPGFGHYELFGIARFAHETVYPGETTNRYLYGTYTDISTGSTVAPALSASGSFTNSIKLGGVGASMRIPVVKNKLTFGAKALYGPGVGRYGASGLSDLTTNAQGKFEPIHNLSGMLTAEATPTPRLLLFLYYGGDYASRADFGSSATTSLATPTAAQDGSGVWGGHWAAPTASAVGYGSRLQNNAACNVTANPGYNGSSTGYYSGASCGAQTRNVQEITGGYWYDIYKGNAGRLRQGLQYGYAVREGWSGLNGIGAKGIENMVFTSFRYYLP